MKRLLKRTLSLILAMIMVMGVLPMNTMAAMIMGEADVGRAETPVIDRSDPIANTHGKSISTGEQPEVPVDPPEESEQPAEPLWDDLEISLSFVVEDGKMMYVVDVAPNEHGGLGSGNWALALVPELHGEGGITPSEAVSLGAISFNDNSSDSMNTAVKGGTSLKEGQYVIHDSTDSFKFEDDGTYRIKGEMPAFNDLLAALQDPNDDVDVEGASFLDVLTGIPFTAILVTQADPPGVAITQADYHPAGHIRDEVYTLDLRDPENITFDGGSADVELDLSKSGTIKIGLTNDGIDEVEVGETSITAGSGDEYISSSGEGAKISAGETKSDVISIGLEGAILEEGGTIVLSVPYTFGDADRPTQSFASVTINVIVGLSVTADPIVFVVTEGFTDDYGPVTVTYKGADVDAAYWDFEDPTFGADMEDTVYGLSFTFDGEAETLTDMAATVTLSPCEDLVAEDDGAGNKSNKAYLTYMTIGVTDADGGSTTLVSVPIKIIVKPKLRTQYTLSYDVNGNDDATAPASSSMFADADPEAGENTFVTVAEGLGDNVGGKKFLGWSEDPNASAGDPAYAPGTEIELERNVKLYAIWETNKVTITFHKNDGVTPEVTATVTGEPGKALGTGTGTVPTWTRAGYTKVTGWFTGPNDTDSAASINTFPASSIDVYAHWTPNDIAITYAKGACVGATFVANGSSQTVKYDQTDAVVRTSEEVFAAIPNGWNFIEWKVSDTKSYDGGDTFDKITTALTLTAQWTINIQFDVTSERPSGSVGTLTAPDTQAITPGGTLTSVPAAPGTLTGYSFDGWYPRLDNGSLGSTKVTDATTFNNPTTLVAKWTIDQYTLTYDMKGHGTSQKPSNSNHNYNSTANLSTTPAVDSKVTESNVHWVFRGWSATDGGSTAITSITMDEDKTVYAIWEKDTHTVTYDLGGASGTAPSSATVTCGGSHTTAAAPTWAGYSFSGWSDGTTTHNASTAITGINSDITLTAQWTPVDNAVRYLWNYTGAPNSGVYATENVATGSSPNGVTDPTRTGYTFKGWYSAATCADNEKIADVTAEVITANTDYYAKWEENDVTVTFHTKSGTWASDYGGTGVQGTSNNYAMTGKYTGTLTAPTADNISRTGYTFGGWATTDGGTTAATVPNTFGAANAHYYAIWTIAPKTVKVTVNKDGDSAPNVSVRVGSATAVNTDASGVATFTVTPAEAGSSYAIVVDGDTVETVTISPTTISTDYTYDYYTIGVTTDTHGTATVKTTANTAATLGGKTATANSGNSYSASIVALSGAALTWSYGTANTDYKADKWTDGSNANDITTETAASGKTHNATYVKKTGSIVVNAKLDTTSAAYYFPNGTVVTIVPTGVALGNATDAQKKTQTVSNATTSSVTFANLEHDSASGWDIYVGSTKIAAGSNVKVTGNDGSSASVNAMYYTVEVKTGGNGDASMTANGSTLSTSYAASPAVTSQSTVVLEQSQVTWTVGTPATDYDFLNWDGDQTNKTAFQNVSITTKTTHTANFSKVSFTVQAVVNLNKVAQTALSTSITAIKAVKTAGTKDDPANLDFTYDTDAGKWVLSGLPTGNTYKVVVTTLTGDFDIATGITTDTSNVTGSFFSVKTADKSDYEDAQAVMAVTAPSASNKTEVVVKSGTSIGLTVDPADGFTHTGWTRTNTTNTVSSNAFAPTDVTTAGTGITLTPTFTFAVPVELRYDKVDGDLVAGQTVAVTGVTVANKGTGNTGEFVVSGMTPGTTYNVVVNGYASQLTLADTMASTSTAQVVVLHKISAVADPTAAGTPKVNSKDVVYVPDKAVIPATGTTAVTATAGTVNSGYRWLTASGETLWTKAASDTATTITTATATSTTITNVSVEADIVLTAHAAKQWTVDVKNTNKTGGTLGTPVVSKGTAVAVNATSGNSLANKVDDGETITVSVTPNPGYTPKWTVTDSSGNAIAGKTVSGNGNAVTVDQDMTITVDWELTTYTVEVKINLDNAAKTDITNPEGAPILYLKKGSDAAIPLTHTTDGVYTAKVVPGNYAIWSPVAGANGTTAQNTGRAINFAVADGEGTGDATKLKAELNYYTIKIVKSFSDSPATAPTDVFAGHGSTAPTSTAAEVTSKIYLAGTGTATTNVAVAATANNSSTPYYKWARWDKGNTQSVVATRSGNYVLAGENTLKADNTITTAAPITLTAVFQRQYKVTLGDPAAAGSSAAPTGGVQANFNPSSGSYSGLKISNATQETSKYALVDQGSTLSISNLSLYTPAAQNSYIYSAWSVDKTGETANGSFASTNTTTGATTFTPVADAVVTPSYWLRPTLTPARDTYHQNYAPNEAIPVDKRPANFGKSNNVPPAFTWTANDADLDGVYITVDGAETKLTAGTEYTYASGVITFKEDYLTKTLKGSNAGTPYTVTVKSKTPAGGTETPLSGTLVIYNTPEDLLSVTIKVNADKSANTPYETLNITEGNKSGQEGRKTAIYKDHTDARIVKENKLTFTWYYGATKPSAEPFEDTEGSTAVAKATAKVGTYSGQPLTGLATLTNTFDLDDATVIPNALLTSDTLKGKYIYAVVEASVTGKGAVITNPIAVDYDAVVKVTKDGSANITGANYTVYLVPQGGTANADSYAAASLPTGSVEAKYQNTNLYKTDDSALTGGVTYDVYVNKVEGDATIYVKTGKTVSTQTAADGAPTVEFFSVNAVETALKHAKDNAGADVGESFAGDAAKPSTVFTTTGAGSNNIDVNSGDGVFRGTQVTAKANKTWAQDYWWNWQSNTTGDAFTSYGTERQASGAATKNYTVSDKTYVGGQMEQKTYTVTGNIWATGNNLNAGIKAPTLTANGHKFNGTVTSNGKHKGTVSFTVPKSSVTGEINENYTLSATPFDGTETGLGTIQVTTLSKYAEYTNVASLTNTTANDTIVSGKAALTNDKIAQVTANNTSAFTIVVTASKWKLTVADDGAGVTDDITTTSQTLNNKTTTAPNAVSTTASFTEKYADRTADKVYQVNLTNDETTNLTVTLTLTRQVMTGGSWGTATTVDLSSLTGGKYTDAANSITIENLPAAAFDLLAGDSLTDTYTVTIPDELEVTRVRYSFAFTSVDKDNAGAFGPSVTYVLDIKVDPLPITAIGSKTITGGYEADGLKLDSKNPPSGVKLDDEVEYVWYTVPVGTVPALTTATGALNATGLAAAAGDQNDGTYKMAAGDTGRDLYLVAKNQGTGNVTQSAMTKVATLPYAIAIKVQEDTAPAANKDNYKVYLWDDANTVAFDPATAFEAVATDTANDGLYKTEAVLVPGETYSVYTNAVGGTTDKHWRDSGVNVVLANHTNNETPTVIYHELVLDNTLVDNQQYSAGITTNDAPFYKTVDGTSVTSIGIDALNAPTAKYGATDAVDVATSATSANRWVQEGATVNLAYSAWTRDYTLTWSDNTTVATNDKASGSTATVAVSAAKTTVKTELELNLYKVALTVAGPGLLSEVTMNDGTRDFTLSAGSFHATGDSVPNIGNGGYTFTVPAGTYTVLGTPGTGSTQIKHYKIPANSSTEILPANISGESIAVADDSKSFLIQLDSVGQYMSVEDDQKPINNTTITAHAAGNAGWDGEDQTDDTAGSTIVLPYGYPAAKTVTVTVANTSGENNNLYDVTWTAATSGNSDKITASAGTLDGTNDILYPSGAAQAGAPLTATLTVDTGLARGTYTYTADVTFNTADGDATHQPKVTYTLTVQVVPTEFIAVTVVNTAGSAVSGMLPLDQGLAFSAFETASENDWDSAATPPAAKTLVAGTDYTYQWYHGTADSASVSWSDTGATSVATVTGASAISGATSATLAASEIAKYPGEKIYLVISAVKGKNVIEAVISDPVTTGFQPVVKITKDHVDQSTVTDFDGTGYTVKLTDASNNTYATAWSDAKGGFVPVDGTGKEISLPSGEYTVYAAKYEGQNPTDIDDMVAQTTKLNLTTTAASKVDEVTVPYFTVNTVKTKAFEAFAGRGLGEDFDGDAKNEGPTPALKFGATAINSGTAVLKGQNVNAVIADGDKWTQDYTLTWYSKLDPNTSGTNTAPTFANAYEATGNTMDPTSTKQNAATAATTGYQNVAVSETLYIGGRLDQNKYTITVNVTGSGRVEDVDTTLTGSDPVESFTGALNDGNDGEFNAGDTMIFTVVAGNYDIAATRGSGTNIVSIQWESEDPVTGDKLSDRPVAKNPAKGNYNVLITIESAELNLTVSDDKTTPNKASAGTGDSKDVTNSEVRYFSGIDPNDELVLSLSNKGNMPLSTTMTVFHFDKIADMPDFATGNWGTSATGYLGAAPASTGDLADSWFQNESRQVITVTDVMANGTTVPAKAGQTGGPDAVTAGTITLGTGAFNKDDGVYVFRFVGDDDDASTTNPVVYYVLNLTIQPLPIKEVAAESANSGAPGVGDKVQLKDATSGTEGGFANVKVNDGTNDVAANTVADPALKDNGEDDADVQYQWVWTATSMTPANVKNAMSVNASTGVISSTNTNVKLLSGNGADSKQYTVQTTELNGYLYLVAYAPGTAVNASELAVSAAIQTKHTAGVKVSLNGTVLPDTTNAVKPDPGYTVYLVESGGAFDPDNTDGTTGTWATTWNTTTARYEAPIDLAKSYDVYALTYKGGDTVVKAIDETLGKQNDNSIERERTVPYYSVKFTEDVDVDNGNAEGFTSYLPGANDLQEALTVQVSDGRNSTNYKATDFLTESADGTPVLAGVNVKVAVDGTAVNDAADPKAWADYATLHTMDTTGWNKDSGTDTSGTKIGYAASIASGHIAVTGQKTFSAKLKPVLFTVKFGVEDISEDGPKTTAIASATLSGGSFEQTVTVAGGGITNGGAHGATVTFTNVPAGVLSISAKEDMRTATMVSGYTWNDRTDVQSKGTNLVTVVEPETPDTNQDTDNNTILIEEAFARVVWYDDFDPKGTAASGYHRTDEDGAKSFDYSDGFTRVDDADGYRSLVEGYGPVTYTVRVENAGSEDLGGFYVLPTATDFTFDLTKVKWYDADGNVKAEEQDATVAFDLLRGDYLEFDVTIPAGKKGNGNDYTGTFRAVCDNTDKLSTYDPRYHVRSPIVFEPGQALVTYGNRKFDTNQNVALTWPTDTGETEPTFTFELLALDGTNDAAILKEINDALSLSLTDLDAKPSWLTMNASTGAFTFTQTTPGTNDAAVGVNVEVNEVDGKLPADFDAYDGNAAYHVEDEVVLFLRATNVQGETFIVSYTVNVEPGQLKIVGDQFNPDDPRSGQRVDKGAFTYTNVTNQIDEDVVATSDLAGEGNNTAKGNTTAKDSKVEVNGVHTVTWTKPTDGDTYVEGNANYTFIVTYKPDTPAEKWNYKPARVDEPILARKPDLSLDFADEIGKYDDVKDILKPGNEYSEVAKPEGYDPDTATQAPEALAYVENAKRLGETITYLDEEPIYTVYVKKIGGLYNMSLTEDEGTKGFQVVDENGDPTDLPEFTGGDETLFFYVKLSALETKADGSSVWAGEHKISFTAAGYTTDVETSQNDTTKKTATYELVFKVEPKVIAEAHVTGPTPPAPGGTPDTNITLTAKDPDGEDIKPNEPDGKGNRPITPKVEWTDKDGNPVDEFEDGEEYTVTVELPADPNYIFVDKDPADDPDPNYTKDGKTDENDDPDKVDDTLIVTVTPEDPDKPKVKVTFEQTIELPKKSHLEFEDVNADNANDKVPHAVEAVRQTITVKKGEALGKYLISLGAYDNTVTDVVVSDVTGSGNKLTAVDGLVWTLEPSSIDAMENVEATPAGEKTTYTLDMTGVDTAKLALGTYTLKLQAQGKDTYGDDVEPATYTITVEVVKATAGVLKFDDVKQDEATPTASDPATTGPAVNNTRGPIPAKKGDKLGKYEIHLGAYDSFIENVTVTQVSNTLPAEGLKWELTPTSADRLEKDGDKLTYTLDMTEVDTNKLSAGTYTLQLKAVGKDINGDDVEATYTLTIRVSTPGGGGGGEAPCPNQVTFLLGLQGTTNDPVMEMVANNGKVSSVPSVTALEGYQFIGWSAAAPTGDMDKDSKRETVDPKTVTVNSDLTFYAVYQKLYDVPKPPFHEHYVIGYPNGNFGPADNINRASVATIIARAVLPNFVEGADYGNPGGYSDVNGHWAASAIAYCSKYGVFNGYTDGTFKPDQSITRQELALVMARLSGVKHAQEMPFADIGDAGAWAVDGIYTAYANGWVNGYIDGTFKPLNPIRRDETVKIFNAYLRRGVDAEGLGALSEYIHSGVASNVTENGTTEYMTWPDVTKDQWAYYEIIEAANDHQFKVDPTVPGGYVVPELWEKCWIDEKWRYHDDLTDGGPTTGLLTAGFRIWSK